MNRSFHATWVSHTHWDRAWYVTFQEYRIRLVRLVDRLLELLQTRPDYRVYMLDGQMAVLEDYLEVRPQRAAELQEHCRQGRIQVGPWYVLADEFLVSPEALIRNLMVGHRMGADYGGVVKLGYVPDGSTAAWSSSAMCRWLRPRRTTATDIARFRHRQRLLLARPGRRGGAAGHGVRVARA